MAQGNSMFSDLIKAGTFIIGSAVGGGLMGKFLSSKVRMNPSEVNHIEESVAHLTRQNIKAYKKQWLDGDIYIGELAAGYYENRTPKEEDRDESNNIEVEDYVAFVRNEVADYFEGEGEYDVYVWYSDTFRGSRYGDANKEAMDAYKTSLFAKAVPKEIAEIIAQSSHPDETKSFIITKTGTRDIVK